MSKEWVLLINHVCGVIVQITVSQITEIDTAYGKTITSTRQQLPFRVCRSTLVGGRG